MSRRERLRKLLRRIRLKKLPQNLTRNRTLASKILTGESSP